MGILCCKRKNKVELPQLPSQQSPLLTNNTSICSSSIHNKCGINDFTFLKYLGKGTYGQVALVRYIPNSKLYAMKILDKKLIAKYAQIIHTKTERDLLVKVNHPFIVNLIFAFQDRSRLYFVTEFMQGGELFFHLHKEHFFSNEQTKLLICEIILALEHIHKEGFIYRDLKPENILLDVDGHIHLTDFGLSIFMPTKHKAYTICGTPQYLAPEILKGDGYDNSVDWWSLGVLMFEMLSGKLPFKFGRNETLTFERYELEMKRFEVPKNFTKEAGRFIKELLVVKPKKRLGYGKNGVKYIKQHKYFDGVDWEDVYNKKVKMMFRPLVDGEEDLSNFSKEFTTMKIPEEWVNRDGNDGDNGKDDKHDDEQNDYDGFSYQEGNIMDNCKE